MRGIFEKGGLVVSTHGATLGPELLRMDQGDELYAPESVPPVQPMTALQASALPPVDLWPVLDRLDTLQRSVDELRAELEARTVAGRLRRLWAFLKGLWQNLDR